MLRCSAKAIAHSFRFSFQYPLQNSAEID